MTFFFELCNKAYSRGEGFAEDYNCEEIKDLISRGKVKINKGNLVFKDTNQFNEPCIAIVDLKEFEDREGAIV